MFSQLHTSKYYDQFQIMLKEVISDSETLTRKIAVVSDVARRICADAGLNDIDVRELARAHIELQDSIVLNSAPKILVNNFRDAVRSHLAIAATLILVRVANQDEETSAIEFFYSVNSDLSKILGQLGYGGRNIVDSFFKQNGITVETVNITELENIIRDSEFEAIPEYRFRPVIPKNISSPYILYDYPMQYLSQISQSNSYDIDRVFDWIENTLSVKIENLIGSKFRIENLWLYRTLNKDNHLTYNLNSSWHKDGDLPGALKVLIYLCDVDANNGPFGFEIINSANEAQRFIMQGVKGTTAFFKSNEVIHSAFNTISAERLTLSFLAYPAISNRNICGYNFTKPFNTAAGKNPFS
jgi:hypothetical protein